MQHTPCLTPCSSSESLLEHALDKAMDICSHGKRGHHCLQEETPVTSPKPESSTMEREALPESEVKASPKRKMSSSSDGKTVDDEKKPQKKIPVAVACSHCNKAHLACDNQRPCRRCVASGKADTCVNTEHKKRGRPQRSAMQKQASLLPAAYYHAPLSPHMSPNHHAYHDMTMSSLSSFIRHQRAPEGYGYVQSARSSPYPAYSSFPRSASPEERKRPIHYMEEYPSPEAMHQMGKISPISTPHRVNPLMKYDYLPMDSAYAVPPTSYNKPYVSPTASPHYYPEPAHIEMHASRPSFVPQPESSHMQIKKGKGFNMSDLLN